MTTNFETKTKLDFRNRLVAGYISLVATLGASRFPIRFEAWYRVLSSALFLSPSDSFVDLAEDAVSVRMGWAFSARFARSAVAATSRLDRAR